jgi:hypothetical protein
MTPDLGDMLQYPLRGDHALRRHAIGGGIPAALAVLGIFAFIVLFFLTVLIPFATLVVVLGTYVVVPLVYLAVYWYWAGYFVRVARDTYAGGTRPPMFGDWGQLLKDGGYAVLIGIAYAVPVVVLVVALGAAIVGLGGGLSALVDGGGGGSELVTLGLVLAALLATAVGFAASVLAAYCYPISVCGYAEHRNVREAFDTARIRAVATRPDYAGRWLLVAGVSFGAYVVVSVLTSIFVGYLLVPLLPALLFYVGVGGFYGFAAVSDEVSTGPA